jgi:hypothetical protein
MIENDYGINYVERNDGSLLVFLSRCNAFDDHKVLGMDGDIPLGVIPREAYRDISDAKFLIDKISERLVKVCQNKRA